MPDFELLADGLRFPEGPIAMPDGSVVLVEIPRGTLIRVDADGTVDVVVETGGGPNGAALGPDGAIYVCNSGGFEWSELSGLLIPGNQPAEYVSGSIQRVDVDSGKVETLYDRCGDHPLRGPTTSSSTVTAASGSPTTARTGPASATRGGPYHALADGSAIREVAYPLDAPNGVGLSPGGDRVYVAETHVGQLLYWNLDGPGQLAGDEQPRGRCLAKPAGRRLFDSLAVDAEGNVSVATIVTAGISTFTPDGEELEFCATDDPLTTNICFGGPDLRTAFITLSGTGRLVACPWPRAGLALTH